MPLSLSRFADGDSEPETTDGADQTLILESSPPVIRMLFWSSFKTGSKHRTLLRTSSSQSADRTTPICAFVHVCSRVHGADASENVVRVIKAMSPL